MLIIVGVFGLGLALLYLFLFNRSTGQGLHDWLTGTFTVRGRSEFDASRLPAVWRPHLAIAGILVLLAATLPLVGIQYVRNPGPEWASLEDLQRAQTVLQRNPEVVGASVSHTQQGDGRRYYVANVRITGDPRNRRPFAVTLAQELRSAVPRLAEEPIFIRLYRGWSMGILSASTSQGYSIQ